MIEGEKSTPLGFGWWASVVCELRRFVHQKSKNPGGEGTADTRRMAVWLKLAVSEASFKLFTVICKIFLQWHPYLTVQLQWQRVSVPKPNQMIGPPIRHRFQRTFIMPYEIEMMMWRVHESSWTHDSGDIMPRFALLVNLVVTLLMINACASHELQLLAMILGKVAKGMAARCPEESHRYLIIIIVIWIYLYRCIFTWSYVPTYTYIYTRYLIATFDSCDCSLHCFFNMVTLQQTATGM